MLPLRFAIPVLLPPSFSFSAVPGLWPLIGGPGVFTLLLRLKGFRRCAVGVPATLSFSAAEVRRPGS